MTAKPKPPAREHDTDAAYYEGWFAAAEQMLDVVYSVGNGSALISRREVADGMIAARALGAARMLRAALATLPGDPEEADVLAATAWLDEETP